MHARSESITAALPIFVNQRLGERGKRPAWLDPHLLTSNPHDEAVGTWEKVALQRDRGWAGKTVVRREDQARPTALRKVWA